MSPRVQSVSSMILLAFLFMALALPSPAAAPIPQSRDWPQWRGPYLNGSTDDPTSLPFRWIPQRGAHWAAPLPGEAGSTPIVSGDRIFLTSTDRNNRMTLWAMCFDRRDGSLLWRKAVPGFGRRAYYNRDASPSPVTDGRRVIFLFGHGALLATDFGGKVLWRRNLERDYGPFAVTFIYSASPLLYRDRLYIPVIRDDTTTYSEYHKRTRNHLDPLLVCINPATGKDIWKTVRPADDYSEENKDSYATPIPWEESPERTSIVTVGANFLTGHDWQSGRELWRMRYGRPGGYRQRVVPTPVLAGGYMLVSKPRRGIMYAVRPGASGEVSSETQVAWQVSKLTTDTPSALAYRGRLYFIQEKEKKMSCLDPATGRVIWSGALGGGTMYFASPTGADGKIYCVNLGGEVVVLAAGDKYNIIGRMAMGGHPTYSSIVAAQGELFIRTEQKLYCVGKAH